jgi:ABC-type glycerol-3-phosphate transport system substrate-binding protein
MSFHLGKPILVMLGIAVLSGGALVWHRSPPRADLVLWVFTDIHSDTYRPLVEEFTKRTGKTVQIEVLTTRAENVRLESMFMTGQTEGILPDLVEIEISHVGKFFRPPIDEIGFLPLNDYLKRDNWDQRLVPVRLATWSKKDVIFGVPHDVHPVSLTYRDDLYRQAGIDLSQAKTWPQLQEMGLQFEKYWRAQGYRTRHAFELSQASPDCVSMMLQQRGVNLVDQHDNVHIDDPIVAETLTFYAQLVAGPRCIAGEAAAGGKGVWATDVLEGNICAFITPDWSIFNLRKYAPDLSGKLRMMPLPRFDPGDAPTATWGGTMMGITRNSKHHDDAWKLIEHLYFSQAGLDARLKVTDILPPVMEQWNDPRFHNDDPFFGGQRVQEIYVDLARQIRPRYVTPVTAMAQTHLAVALNRAVSYIRNHGVDGLQTECQGWLDFAASDLKARIRHGRFED